MRKPRWDLLAVLGILVVGALALGPLLFGSRSSAAGVLLGQQSLGGDSIWRALLGVALLVLTLGLYAALMGAIVVWVRALDRERPAGHVGWVRLGLAMGGIIGLYELVVNVPGIWLPTAVTDAGPSGFLLGTLPLLLSGVVGLIGGYRGGGTLKGTSAGLLAGFLGLVISQLSWVLLVALAWNAIQHHLVPSAVEVDFQRYTQAIGHAPSLSGFLNLELFEDGIGPPLIVGAVTMMLEGLCATLGGAIGARLARADARRQASQPAVPAARLVVCCAAVVGLAALVWTFTGEFNAVGATHHLLSPGDLGGAFANSSFALWLLGMLVVLAFVLVRGAPRMPHARPAEHAASG